MNSSFRPRILCTLLSTRRQMSSMFDIVLSAVLTMRIVIADVDYDGSHTYLLEEVRTSGAERPRHIAFTSMDPLPVKEGEIFRMKVDGECALAYGIDESIKTYWASYRAWT